MKLVKQSKLFFKEGNSDKVYEIDLCEVGSNQYVVNFRFGKRGSTLKEGTKTDKPVSLNSAQQVFDTLEAEKRRKGYQSEQEMFQALPTLAELASTASIENALLKRLQGFIDGRNPLKSQWKPSRVIWKVGELKLKEAVPYIIRLTDRGDEMQRYTALWALGRISDAAAIQTLKFYFSNPKYSDKVRRIAGASLLQMLTGDERKEHIAFYTERLPEDLKTAIQNPAILQEILPQKVLQQTQTTYDFLEDLYLISVEYPAIKPILINLLKEIPLKPGYFRAVRHILKIAELRDDFEVLGLLSYRFERTLQMFDKPVSYGYDDEESRESTLYVTAIGKSVKVKSELKKNDSRLAYSDRTRGYLIRKSLRLLKESGANQQDEYIKLALAILLSYDSEKDYRDGYSRDNFRYLNNYQNWENVRTFYPPYANAVLMNLILYGGGTRLTFAGNAWALSEKQLIGSSQPNLVRNTVQPNQENNLVNRVFNSIFSLFSKPDQPNDSSNRPSIDQQLEPMKTEVAKIRREELYPELWDKFPQAYIQLLLKAKVDNIHLFAYKNLTQHPDYEKIKAKIDWRLLELLLSSKYTLPATYGLEIVKEKLEQNAERSIILALLNSPFQAARELGQGYISKDLAAYFNETTLLSNLIFSKYSDVRQWVNKTLSTYPLSDSQKQVLVGRGLGLINTLQENTEENNLIIKDGTAVLLNVCADLLKGLNDSMIVDLLKTPVEATQVFAVKIITLKNTQPPAEILSSLLISPFEQVRKAGAELLSKLKEVLATNKDYATGLVNFLVPFMTRKEPYEGLHEDIRKILTHQLVNYLQSVDSTTIIRLIHANYRPAQDLGLVLLRQYINPDILTIRHIIDIGNHEMIAYREWVWSFFNESVARIKYERDEAIRLLDSKWDDNRAFAIHFFRTNFTQDDWSPEVLAGIVDSVKPDIEAFGRELISRFFDEEQGEEYLLKLSQHPSVSVQLFATNYLQRFATGDASKLAGLATYFRSALTRVNKGRSAKARIFAFLHQEAMQSAEAAEIVADILRDISATVSIEDKAICITIMRDLQKKYNNLSVPIKVLDFPTKAVNVH
ncbi:HEAT repeat domain-containing protein [Emticicia agri]|uniref:WGR domain-containing protein n=1 Tax=Emticicia agri TaxID=2492393 RepID=A0A4Q5M153_9BACT|nr:HEAT repeat domain-containing protein [Emticicia agri]RYU95765.1 WGR domain-containing protein [Emticicia agri]